MCETEEAGTCKENEKIPVVFEKLDTHEQKKVKKKETVVKKFKRRQCFFHCQPCCGNLQSLKIF